MSLSFSFEIKLVKQVQYDTSFSRSLFIFLITLESLIILTNLLKLDFHGFILFILIKEGQFDKSSSYLHHGVGMMTGGCYLCTSK